jgi:hypothetical protein
LVVEGEEKWGEAGDKRRRQEGFEIEPNFFWCGAEVFFFSWKYLAAPDRSLDCLEWSYLACQIAEEAVLPSSFKSASVCTCTVLPKPPKKDKLLIKNSRLPKIPQNGVFALPIT